jgi:hypothetical protein
MHLKVSLAVLLTTETENLRKSNLDILDRLFSSKKKA